MDSLKMSLHKKEILQIGSRNMNQSTRLIFGLSKRQHERSKNISDVQGLQSQKRRNKNMKPNAIKQTLNPRQKELILRMKSKLLRHQQHHQTNPIMLPVNMMHKTRCQMIIQKGLTNESEHIITKSVKSRWSHNNRQKRSILSFRKFFRTFKTPNFLLIRKQNERRRDYWHFSDKQVE